MKRTIIAITMLAASVPASAQFGGLSGTIQRAQEAKQAADELTITDAEEQKIGEDVSIKLRQRFGVVQDPAIHRYVTLLGTTLAKNSERPALNWTFIVLDTDGVNAFAAPGGVVHVTRGVLALAKNEAEISGVIGHEIGHVVKKHTINAIRKSKMVKMGASAASHSAALQDLANRAYENILENDFDRKDELDADSVGVALSRKAGYAAASFGDLLGRLADRNKGQAERNGLFASHPETQERIDKVKQLAGTAPAALVEPRYKSNVQYELKTMSELSGQAPSMDASGANKKTVTEGKQNSQVQASGGARGLGADRAAKGGSNPNPVKTTVSVAELDTFKKGIV
jgi:beta-barrel assembly-enhancing protease